MLALIFLAAGCSVGPNYEKPDLPVPAAWTEAQQKGVDARAIELTRWWTKFNDPLLDSLVERAAKSNLDLRLAEARIREARASRAVTASGAWPTVDVSGSYTRNRASENAIGVPAPGRRGSALVAAPISIRTFTEAASTPIGKSMCLAACAGALRRRMRPLKRRLKNRRDVLVTLLGEVARNYIDLRGFQRQLAVARANLKTQQDTLELTQVRFQAGLASDLDVAQQEAQVNTTASQIPTLESGLKQAAYALDVLLGSQPGALWGELAKETEIPSLPPEVLVGLPSDLLRRRPDVRRAERQLAAATALVGAATADLFPKFFLTGVAGLQSVSASDWINGGSRFWSIGPRITWPVFDAGRIRANIEIRNAQQEQALTQYEKSILTALGDVETALVNYANEQVSLSLPHRRGGR